MRLPHLLLESPFFLFENLAEFKKALDGSAQLEELQAIETLVEAGLPPVTSRHALATMFGVNPGLIWSMENKTSRYYRSFTIPKGNTVRRIYAPRVALKIIQKWLSVQLVRVFTPPAHVFGFIEGRSHIQAAGVHVGARWIFSIDIRNFFPTTPQELVTESLKSIGFSSDGAILLARLCCLNGALTQGAPSSPILSNLCFSSLDEKLSAVAEQFSVRLTRYADDIVLSGKESYPEGLKEATMDLFHGTPWTIADEKTELSSLPQRLKVHGLLVHGDTVRLTKGYRHRLRAYRHLVARNGIKEEDLNKVKGHLIYGNYIDSLSPPKTT